MERERDKWRKERGRESDARRKREREKKTEQGMRDNDVTGILHVQGQPTIPFGRVSHAAIYSKL